MRTIMAWFRAGPSRHCSPRVTVWSPWALTKAAFWPIIAYDNAARCLFRCAGIEPIGRSLRQAALCQTKTAERPPVRPPGDDLRDVFRRYLLIVARSFRRQVALRPVSPAQSRLDPLRQRRGGDRAGRAGRPPVLPELLPPRSLAASVVSLLPVSVVGSKSNRLSARGNLRHYGDRTKAANEIRVVLGLSPGRGGHERQTGTIERLAAQRLGGAECTSGRSGGTTRMPELRGPAGIQAIGRADRRDATVTLQLIRAVFDAHFPQGFESRILSRRRVAVAVG